MSRNVPVTSTVSYVLVHVARLYRAHSEVLLRAHDLHPGQEIFLMSLWREEGATQSQLAAQLNVQPATLTNMLNHLAAAGMIERRPDPTDGRAWRVFFTPAGRATFENLRSVWNEMEQCVTAGMNTDEKRNLHQLLARVEHNLHVQQL